MKDWKTSTALGNFTVLAATQLRQSLYHFVLPILHGSSQAQQDYLALMDDLAVCDIQ